MRLLRGNSSGSCDKCRPADIKCRDELYAEGAVSPVKARTFASVVLLSLKYFLYACLLPGAPWLLGRDGIVRGKVCTGLHYQLHALRVPGCVDVPTTAQQANARTFVADRGISVRLACLTGARYPGTSRKKQPCTCASAAQKTFLSGIRSTP